jgi:hypothetical protein
MYIGSDLMYFSPLLSEQTKHVRDFAKKLWKLLKSGSGSPKWRSSEWEEYYLTILKRKMAFRFKY